MEACVMSSPTPGSPEREGVDACLQAGKQSALNDEEWLIIEDVLFPAGLNGAEDFEEAARLTIKIRASQRGVAAAHSKRSTDSGATAQIEVPEHWRRYCARLFAEHRSEALAARAALGLSGPLPVTELEAYLADVAERERHEGDILRLYFLRPSGEIGVRPIWRGYVKDELRELRRQGVLRGGTPPPTPPGMSEDEWLARPEADLGRNTVFYWIATRENRLCRVHVAGEKLAKQTGCSLPQATVFLLCDATPQLPWLSYQVYRYDKGRRHAFNIHVGSPLVPAEDVRRFYLAVRDAATKPRDGRSQTRRGRNPWTYQLLAFVGECMQEQQSWREIFGGWNEAYPEHPYKSVPAMQRSFYQAGGKKRPSLDDWDMEETLPLEERDSR
jgi:hypothetical protein